MALNLSKTNIAPYDYLSTGDESNPAIVSQSIDNTGGLVDTSVAIIYLVATEFNYSDINLNVIDDTQTGIDWRLSVDNITWKDSLTPIDLPDMNALSATQTKTVYVKAVINNNSIVPTGAYMLPYLQLQAIENSS